MLTRDQIDDAVHKASLLRDVLVSLQIANDIWGKWEESEEAEVDRHLIELLRILGYRIEPITPHAVLKQELVESLSGRDEPSAELVEMRERVK